MPDSQKLKDLEAEMKIIITEHNTLTKRIHAEQWRIVQEETGVREGSVVEAGGYDYKVTGLYGYCQPNLHSLNGIRQGKDGEFRDRPRGICGDWKLKGKGKIMGTLNTEQRAILDHTMNRAANRHYCGNSSDMQYLVRSGLMEFLGRKSFVSGAGEYFTITSKGKKALQEGW